MPCFYLAAGAIAAVAAQVCAAGIVAVAAAAAAEQNDQNDDPPNAIAAEAIAVTHNRYLRNPFSEHWAHSMVFHSNKKVHMLFLLIFLGKFFKEVCAFYKDLFIKVKIVRMQGGDIPCAQEEEQPRQSLLIPGKIFGDHAGCFQLLKIHQFPPKQRLSKSSWETTTKCCPVLDTFAT